MLLTIAIAVLAACGVILIVWSLFEAAFLPPQEDMLLVVSLRGGAGKVEQTVRACLRLRQRRGACGKLIFVDGGLDPEEQTAAELLLRGEADTMLCAAEQLPEIIRQEREKVGAGAN